MTDLRDIIILFSFSLHDLPALTIVCNCPITPALTSQNDAMPQRSHPHRTRSSPDQPSMKTTDAEEGGTVQARPFSALHRMPIIPRPKAARRSVTATAAPTFDRLYSDYFRKQKLLEEHRRTKELETQLATIQVHCTPASRQLASHRTASGYSSYGERLYVEGRLGALQREREAAYIRQQEQELELAEATFHPRISKMAQNIRRYEPHHGIATGKRSAHQGPHPTSTGMFCSSGDDKGVIPAVWERLYSQGSNNLRRQSRLDALRKENEEQELKECSFKPNINKQSDALITERRKGFGENVPKLSTYKRLYADDRHRRSKKEEASLHLSDEYTFMPRIHGRQAVASSSSTTIDGQVASSSIRLHDLERMSLEGSLHGMNSVKMRTDDVVARLLRKGEEYNAKREEAQTAKQHPVNPITGERYFHPKISRPPRGRDRNPSKAPIGEYLYSLSDEVSTKAAQLKEKAQKEAELLRSKAFVNSTSERIMENLRLERLRAIFAYLLTEHEFCYQSSNSSMNNGKNASDVGSIHSNIKEEEEEAEYDGQGSDCCCVSSYTRCVEEEPALEGYVRLDNEARRHESTGSGASNDLCDRSLQQSATIPNRIDLLQVVQNEHFMQTIDPEVRADIEHAAFLLERRLARYKHELNTMEETHEEQRRGASWRADDENRIDGGSEESVEDDGRSVTLQKSYIDFFDDAIGGEEKEGDIDDIVVGSRDHSSFVDCGNEPVKEDDSNESHHTGPYRHSAPSSLHQHDAGVRLDDLSINVDRCSARDSQHGPGAECSALVDEAMFIELMQEVLQSSKGIVRQYLLPMPTHRKKWVDPSFHPTVDPHSIRLAARKRPGTVPTHEILYQDAQRLFRKREIDRLAFEIAVTGECSFKPVLTSASRSAKGKALELAQEWKQKLAEREHHALSVKADREAEWRRKEEAEAEEAQRRMEAWRSAARRHCFRHRSTAPGRSYPRSPLTRSRTYGSLNVEREEDGKDMFDSRAAQEPSLPREHDNAAMRMRMESAVKGKDSDDRDLVTKNRHSLNPSDSSKYIRTAVARRPLKTLSEANHNILKESIERIQEDVFSENFRRENFASDWPSGETRDVHKEICGAPCEALADCDRDEDVGEAKLSRPWSELEDGIEVIENQIEEAMRRLNMSVG